MLAMPFKTELVAVPETCKRVVADALRTASATAVRAPSGRTTATLSPEPRSAIEAVRRQLV